MTEEQINKYRKHLQSLIEETSNKLADPVYVNIKEFLRGKLQAYTVALDSLDVIIIEDYRKR